MWKICEEKDYDEARSPPDVQAQGLQEGHGRRLHFG